MFETPRMIIEELQNDDAEFILELMNEPAWKRFIGDRGLRVVEDANTYLRERLIPAYQREGFGFWRCRERHSGQVMGIAGLVRREVLPNPDLGYGFLSRFHGRGYGLEAALGVLHFARTHLKLQDLCAIVQPDNLASIRLLEKLGFQRTGSTCLPGESVQLLLYTSHALAT